MPEHALSEEAEEALAQLWVIAEEEDRDSAINSRLSTLDSSTLRAQYGDSAIAQLIEAGLVQERVGAHGCAPALSLTHSGTAEAASVIRRERLAERLLTDVLEIGEAEVEATACEFEHLLRRGIDDEICTLLGHPRFCPHGSPIPSGPCCRARPRSPGKVISALADLSPGQSGVVAYIHGHRRELMQRMLAMGVIPGAPVTLVQSTPSYLFQLGQTQLAVDRETAQDIYLRITQREPTSARRTGWLPASVGRLRLRRRRGRR